MQPDHLQRERSSVFCAGVGKTPQPYQVQVGEYRYLLSQDPTLHGIMVAASDTPSVEHTNIATWNAAKTVGVKADGQGVYITSAAAPQSALTSIIQAAKANKSTFVYNEVTSGTIIQLRNEAQLQGLTTVKYWMCHIGCYDNKVLASAPQQYEGIYSEMNILPFYTERTSNPSLNALITQLGDASKTNTYGVDSWVAAMLFQDAVVKAAGTGTLNRQTCWTRSRARTPRTRTASSAPPISEPSWRARACSSRRSRTASGSVPSRASLARSTATRRTCR